MKVEDIYSKAFTEYPIKEKLNEKAVGTYDANYPRRKAFIAGAEWMRDKMIEKAADWFQDYLFDIGYPDDWLRDSRVLVSGRDRFIKAMQDESK